MSDKSFYNEKAGVVLQSFTEEDISLLKKHSDTKRVQLWVVESQLESLDFLLDCSHLEELDIYGWKINDFSFLGKMPNLKFLFLNGGTSNNRIECIDFVSNIISLEHLSIHRYPKVTCFPNLQKLVNLLSVEIGTCKKLSDLSPISFIPNLQGFGILETPNEVNDLEFIAAKPGMKAMSAQFGNKKKNDDFNAMIKDMGLHHGHILRDGSVSCSIDCPICE